MPPLAAVKIPQTSRFHLDFYPTTRGKFDYGRDWPFGPTPAQICTPTCKRDLTWYPHVHRLVTAGGWNTVTRRLIDTARPKRHVLLGFCPLFHRTPHLIVASRSLIQLVRSTTILISRRLSASRHTVALHRHLDHVLARRRTQHIEPPSGFPEIPLR